MNNERIATTLSTAVDEAILMYENGDATEDEVTALLKRFA